MLSNFCPKHRISRALCGCLIFAAVAGPVSGMVKGDPQAKLPPIQNLMIAPTTTTLTTSAGTVAITIISDTTIPGKKYVSVRQDQQRQAVLGPPGPRGDT
jgi:hypothetical protein